jgi:hypothetical protein
VGYILDVALKNHILDWCVDGLWLDAIEFAKGKTEKTIHLGIEHLRRSSIGTFNGLSFYKNIPQIDGILESVKVLKFGGDTKTTSPFAQEPSA